MFDALRAEWFKVSHRRMTYILLAAAMALTGLFYVILWLRIRDGADPGVNGIVRLLALKDGISFKNVVPYGFALERFFATLVCVIFSGTMMGNEYDWRTVGMVTGRGVKRWHFIFAKVVSSVLFTLLTVALCFIVAMIASAWFSHLYDLPFGSFNAARGVDIFASAGRTSFVILPFALMSLAFATQWRSAGQAVGASLGFYFIEGIFTSLLHNARGILSHIPDALFNVNGDAVMRANGVLGRSGEGGPFFIPDTGPPVWRGGFVLGLWIAIFVLALFWRFQRRDIQE